jgi:hypothetical protein
MFNSDREAPSIFSTRERDEAAMRAVSTEVMQELEPDVIDRVFVKSAALEAGAVYNLVQAMANVGLVELNGANVMMADKDVRAGVSGCPAPASLRHVGVWCILSSRGRLASARIQCVRSVRSLSRRVAALSVLRAGVRAVAVRC